MLVGIVPRLCCQIGLPVFLSRAWRIVGVGHVDRERVGGDPAGEARSLPELSRPEQPPRLGVERVDAWRNRSGQTSDRPARVIFISRSVSTSGMTPNHWRSSPSRSSAVLVGTRSTGKGIWACADPPAIIVLTMTQSGTSRRNMGSPFRRPKSRSNAREKNDHHSSLADVFARVKLRKG